MWAGQFISGSRDSSRFRFISLGILAQASRDRSVFQQKNINITCLRIMGWLNWDHGGIGNWELPEDKLSWETNTVISGSWGPPPPTLSLLLPPYWTLKESAFCCCRNWAFTAVARQSVVFLLTKRPLFFQRQQRLWLRWGAGGRTRYSVIVDSVVFHSRFKPNLKVVVMLQMLRGFS